MNADVARLTARTLLGRRRTSLLLLLPLTLIALCVLARMLAGLESGRNEGIDPALAADLIGAFGLATLLPLLGLIAGTGVIGPEIDDGSIVYLLSKPLNRHSIILTKVAVAIGVVTAFGAAPIAVAGLVLTGELGGITAGYTVGALVAGIAYCAVFVLLGVISRNAVVIGLIYALVWESLVGQIVPGARALSIQQWGLALTERIVGTEAETLRVTSAVGLGTGGVLLAVVTVGCVWYAGHRLRTLRFTQES